MKMLNCPECGLTITDVQEECPKCRTKIEDIKEELEKEVEEVKEKKVTKKTPTKKKPAKKTKDEVIEAALAAEEVAPTEATEATSMKIKEEMIAAVVEAEALAAIEEEEEAGEANLCETCLAPVDEGQNFCQLCGASVEAIEETVTSVIPKTDAESNKLIAAIGYIFFFFPILCGYYRNSAFAKFHAKQATLLFISSTLLFLGLIMFREILDSLFLTSSVADVPSLEDIWSGAATVDINGLVSTPWHRGHMTGGLFYHYLVWMLYALHLIPFALMLVGIVNSIQGKERRLPIIGRFVKNKKTKTDLVETME